MASEHSVGFEPADRLAQDRESLRRRFWSKLKRVAAHLPFADSTFDLVVSINTLHNLYNYDLDQALKEIERVGKNNKYICVEGYRNEEEKVNLMYWQLTCRAFHTPQEWEWVFKQAGYQGDWSFIYFE